MHIRKFTKKFNHFATYTLFSITKVTVGIIQSALIVQYIAVADDQWDPQALVHCRQLQVLVLLTPLAINSLVYRWHELLANNASSRLLGKGGFWMAKIFFMDSHTQSS